MDGTSPQVVVSLSPGEFPTGIAIDSNTGKIYWTDQLGNNISVADLNGAGEQTLVVTDHPYGVVLDTSANVMYWTDGLGGHIFRANLDGSDQVTILSGLSDPTDIALDLQNGKIYWSSQFGQTAISRANLDGSDLQTLVSGLPEPTGLVLDETAGKVFWLDWTGAIYDANLDGTDLQTLSAGAVGALGLTLDPASSTLYWTSAYDAQLNTSGTIWSANLDGTNQQALVGGLDFPDGIAFLSGNAPQLVPERATILLFGIGLAAIIRLSVKDSSLTLPS